MVKKNFTKPFVPLADSHTFSYMIRTLRSPFAIHVLTTCAPCSWLMSLRLRWTESLSLTFCFAKPLAPPGNRLTTVDNHAFGAQYLRDSVLVASGLLLTDRANLSLWQILENTNFEQRAWQSQTQSKILQLLAWLDNRGEDILLLMFNCGPGGSHTDMEICLPFGVLFCKFQFSNQRGST